MASWMDLRRGARGDSRTEGSGAAVAGGAIVVVVDVAFRPAGSQGETGISVV